MATSEGAGSRCRACNHDVPAGAVRCLFCGQLLVVPSAQPRRDCPRCNETMKPTPTQWIVVDRCDRCRGEFYDVGEADRLLVLDAAQRAWLQRNSVRRTPDTPDRKPLRCPGCAKGMETFEMPGPVPVVVDVCPGCHGLWLDAGELSRIRDVARARIVPKSVSDAPGTQRAPASPSPARPSPAPTPAADDNPVRKWLQEVRRAVLGRPPER